MKLIAAMLLVATLAGCGHPLVAMTPQGWKEYPTVGLFNEEKRSNDVCYELSMGNVIWSIILIETIVFPVYFVGWSIFNPIPCKP